MKSMTEVIAEQNQVISESAIYEDIISRLEDARENGTPVEEGLLGAMVGGIAGATVVPMVMKALCKVLGVDPKGQFGSLLTSRLVLTAVGASVGWNK